MSLNRWLLHPAAKPVAFVAALGPLAWLLGAGITGNLGANPAEALIRGTGDWTLRFLWATLAVTPLRQAFGWTALLRLRRMLGLYAFFYGLMHFTAYAWLDQGFEIDAILKDIGKRPFILVGTAALLGMLPLAATSFDRAVRALGGRRWRALHRAVYAVAVAALIHFLWMRSGKNLYGEVGVYAAILAVLFGWRLWHRFRPAPGASPSPAVSQRRTAPGKG